MAEPGIPQQRFQTFRPHYSSDLLPAFNNRIDVRITTIDDKDIVLWGDIQAAVHNAEYITYEGQPIDFLVDEKERDVSSSGTFYSVPTRQNSMAQTEPATDSEDEDEGKDEDEDKSEDRDKDKDEEDGLSTSLVPPSPALYLTTDLFAELSRDSTPMNNGGMTASAPHSGYTPSEAESTDLSDSIRRITLRDEGITILSVSTDASTSALSASSARVHFEDTASNPTNAHARQFGRIPSISKGRSQGVNSNLHSVNTIPAPRDVQGQVLQYMEQLQSLLLHEVPMPQLFIVMPKSCPNENQARPYADGYRLFWICEHGGDHPDGFTVNVDRAHEDPGCYLEAVHGGFELERHSEFFMKYGDILQLNLQAFMYSRHNEAMSEPPRSARSSGPRKESVGYDEGIVFLGKALGMTNQQVEWSLTWIQNHLVSLTLHSTTMNRSDARNGAKDRAWRLTPDDLKDLRSYICQAPDPSAGPKERGNLYRSVDASGHVRWVCSIHYCELHPFFFPIYVKEALRSSESGYYGMRMGQISMQPRSGIEALNIYSSLVAISGCLSELTLEICWDVTLEELRNLRDAIVCFGVVCVQLTGPGLRRASAAHAEVIIEILSHPRIQSFKLECAQGILKHLTSVMLPTIFPGLRTLELSLETTGSDLDTISRGLSSVVMTALELQELVVKWEEFEEVFDLEDFLRRITFELSEPIRVSLEIRGHKIGLTTRRDGACDASVECSDLLIAWSNHLVSGGRVGKLTITNTIDMMDKSNHELIERILENSCSALRVLQLNCDMHHFKTAAELIREYLLKQQPRCGFKYLFLVDSTRPSAVSKWKVSFPFEAASIAYEVM
ncbi:hypothetical protein BGZ54_003201 [Gamsiella multidivaricata]|nr:hypothetical protein BGZ54_003201 [Gamsiella multidivaricata]